MSPKKQQMYYLYSTKHTHDKDYAVTWWGPDRRGYVCDLDQAGKYTKEQADSESDGVEPVPCEVADEASMRVIEQGNFLYNYKRKIGDQNESL